MYAVYQHSNDYTYSHLCLFRPPFDFWVEQPPVCVEFACFLCLLGFSPDALASSRRTKVTTVQEMAGPVSPALGVQTRS